VFLTTDNGTLWVAAKTGMTDTTVLALTVSNGNLFAATVNSIAGTFSGVWRRPLSEMTAVHNGTATELPKEFSLSQNYPNPFNPATTIRYSLPSSSRVNLGVYNVLGQLVSELVNEEATIGWKEVQWNAEDVPSGVYFYRLQAGTFAETKKLILLK
jgi:hypothetical protein